jgi:hypothetical protein
MLRIRAIAVAAALAGSAIAGAALATVLHVNPGLTANAATASPPAASTSPGAFKSNEDPTHEQGETAAQEAAENSGQRPQHGAGPGRAGGAFTPNENPQHEAGESAAQEAAENSGQRPAGPRPSPSASPSA